MSRIADLLGAVAAAADEGPDGLELAPQDRAMLREGWSDDDLDDALGLVRDSLLLGELVEASDALAARLTALLGAFGDAEAFENARSGGGRIPLVAMAHLTRSLDRLEEILDVYRDDPAPDRSGLDALRRRLADLDIEAEMRGEEPES